MPRVAILPSNQHQNEYKYLSGVTEEKWAVEVYKVLEKRLRERGATVKTFYIPGSGTKSTDELAEMIEQAVAWRPDYMLSVHSDAVGDKKQTGILMLMPRESDRAEGRTLGNLIAARVGLPYKGSWVYGQESRKIMYLKALRDYKIPGSLVEVGEHATAVEAKWNWEHTREIGVGIADALADYLGLEEDMPIDHVSDENAKAGLGKLIKAGIITKPEAHKLSDAAGVSLLWSVLGRIVDKAGLLPKP